MSIMESVRKAKPTDEQLLKKKHVRNVLEMVVEGGAEGAAQLEVLLLEGALEDLAYNSDTIRTAAQKKVDAKKTETKKFYRAVAKTRFATGVNPPDLVWKSEFITIPEYERRDGTHVPEHRRRLPQGHTAQDRAEREDIADELEQVREYQRAQEDRYGLDKLDGLADKVFNSEEAKVAQGAISTFLNESSVGQGITAVAGFFSRSGGKLQFAARAINEFGPWAGGRMAYNYFRYGGYDVPMVEKNGNVYTEMGDRLPEVKSQKDTRMAVIDILAKRLPGQEAEDSNAEPPSEGFIIDKDGHVLAHGVGRGNDHFLPFNARHLKSMRDHEGVEYVRRRMYGGPTSEDLHAAMMMGADKLTVVSNVGTFTIDLTRRSHGLKMEHMQVLARYQELLDRNKNENDLDFDGYNSALRTMNAEFPLHFGKPFTKSGDWSEKGDRIQPENRFLDGLRSIFNNLAGNEMVETTRGDEGKSESRSTGYSPKVFAPGGGGGRGWGADGLEADPGRNQNPKMLPWTIQNITQDEWIRRQTQNRPRFEVLGQVINSAKRAGYKPPKWAMNEREKAKSEGQTPGQKAMQRPTGQQVQPTQQAADLVLPKEVQGRLRAINLDPGNIPSRKATEAKSFANVIMRIDDDEWDEMARDPSYVDMLRDTFQDLR